MKLPWELCAQTTRPLVYIHTHEQPCLNIPHSTMQPITPQQHAHIISLLPNYTHHKIASKTGLSRSTVDRVAKEVELDKENSKGGCPAKLSETNKCSIACQITSGHIDNAVQAAQFINPIIPQPIHPQTIRRALKKNNFQAVIKRKCPLLTQKHRQERLKFAHTHSNWTVEDWKRVLWSDETKINRIGNDGRVYVWKPKGEPLSDRTTTPTVKHGGGNNLMIWGCMGWNGVGVVTEVQGIMNAKQYCEILDGGVVESFERLGMEEGERYFQQDNDPKHTSKMADKWFQDKNIAVLGWPAQSPDLNPIERLWHHLKKLLQKYPTPPKGVHELWNRVAVEWDGIDPKMCQTLIESMPSRIQAVIKAKGGHTKY